jgi:hypothetical protein
MDHGRVSERRCHSVNVWYFGGAIFAFMFAVVPVRADIVSERPDGVALTLYHDGDLATLELLRVEQNPGIRDSGLAFITEKRTIDLPAGPAIVKFRGVASTMVPQTAVIEGLPAGVLEQDFDYDLLTPGSLLAKSVGETVRLVRTGSKTGKLKEESAIVRSGPDGAMFEIDGRLEALRCSGLPEKLVFDRLPEGLTDTPTLSVRTVAPVAGRYTISLSYIATGLNWSADYVARIAPGSDKLALTGWLTIANFSATSFANVPVAVVAGRLETTGEDKPTHPTPLLLATNCWPTKIDWATYPRPMSLLARRLRGMPMQAMYAPSPVTAVGQQEMKMQAIEARQFGDYKLYALPEPTTVAAQQTKQIQFLDQRAVHFERVYRYDVNGYSTQPDMEPRVSIVYKLRNRSEFGLGKPLPAGGVSVFDSGPEDVPVFAGRNRIGDMAVGLPVEVETGGARDVRVEPHLIESLTSGKSNARTATDLWEITVENDKPFSIAFELRQELYGGEATIMTESMPSIAEYGSAIWRLALVSGERSIISYRIMHP